MSNKLFELWIHDQVAICSECVLKLLLHVIALDRHVNWLFNDAM